MIFQPSTIPEVIVIEPKVFGDARGFFFESWNARAFSQAGITETFVQDNHSRSTRGVLRGLHYHSGVVFAVYAEGCANALALGGRYDEVGKAFGRARPATGFSMDLRDVMTVAAPVKSKVPILAPHRPRDAALQRRIAALRNAGESVIVDLPGHEKSRAELGCNRRLTRAAGVWKIVKN